MYWLKKFLITIAVLSSASYTMAQAIYKPLDELVNTKESAWPAILSWAKSARNNVILLPKDAGNANKGLVDAQVTTRSALGAIIYESGGILVDSGWVRMLGSGSPRLSRSLMDWNLGKSYNKAGERPSFLLVADDVLGGFFAINAGGISDTAKGKVFYLAPDVVKWECLDLGYPDFINFIFNTDLNSFYQNLRWRGWQAEVSKMNGDKGFSCYPFLFTKEAADMEKVTRTETSIQELWDFYYKKVKG